MLRDILIMILLNAFTSSIIIFMAS